MESENFKAKNFELAMLIPVCLRPKEIVSWDKRSSNDAAIKRNPGNT